MKMTFYAIALIGVVGAIMPRDAIGQRPGDPALPPLNENVDSDPRFSDPSRTNIIRRQPTILQPRAALGGFDASDPTQSAPDMRLILEGEQQVRRAPLPPIEVAGKVIRADGTAKALLRVNGRYFMIATGTTFSVNTGADPVVFTVGKIDMSGIDITSKENNQQLRLP